MVSGPGVWREAARASCPSAQAPTLVASGDAHLPLARLDPKLLHTGCSEDRFKHMALEKTRKRGGNRTVKNEAFRIQYSVLYCFDKQNQGFGQKSGFTGSLQVLSPVTKSCMSAVTSIDAVTCSVFFSTKVCFTFT